VIHAHAAIFTLAGTAVDWTRRHFGPEKRIRRRLTSNRRPQPGCSPALISFGFRGCNVLTYRCHPLFDLMRGPDRSFLGAVYVLQFWHEKNVCCSPASVGVCLSGFCREPPSPSPPPSPPRARLKRTPVPGCTTVDRDAFSLRTGAALRRGAGMFEPCLIWMTFAFPLDVLALQR
jgi:hypothetical protein